MISLECDPCLSFTGLVLEFVLFFFIFFPHTGPVSLLCRREAESLGGRERGRESA